MIVYAISFGTAVGVIQTKLKYMEQKLDKHNQVVERTYNLEKEMAVRVEEIKVANHRIEDLEG
jgi:hypothetical protein